MWNTPSLTSSTNEKKKQKAAATCSTEPSGSRACNPDSRDEDIIRICMLGCARVGKTSIVRRMLGKSFVAQYVPTVYESYTKYIKLGEKNVLVDIHDMAGSFHFPAMEQWAVENANIILIVFALDDFESYQHAVDVSVSFESKKTTTPILVVGNKSDMVDGNGGNRSKIEEFITNAVQRNYVEMSAKYDRYADRLLNEIFEAHEVCCGPYRVKVAK